MTAKLFVSLILVGWFTSVGSGYDGAGGGDYRPTAELAAESPGSSGEGSSALEQEKSQAISVSLDYTIVSDYIFRGANFSEYAGEGREKLNHQLGFGIELDTAELGANLGTFGFFFWGEWYADQVSALNTPLGTGNSLQEVDYTISWSYEIAELFTTVELGWIAYTFPQTGGDAHYTHEWYVSLGFDDSVLFGTEGSVLNPYVAYYWDVDDVDGAWLEWGISHGFGLADLGLGSTAVLKDITITPSLVMGVDNGQMGKSMRMANLQYGIDVGYDISAAIGMPEKCGSIGLNLFLYFSDAVHDAFLNDEFWGGMTLSYAW